MPAGWAFGEKVTRGGDVYGVRVQPIFRDDFSTLDKLNSAALSQQKPNAVLQRALDVLALLE